MARRVDRDVRDARKVEGRDELAGGEVVHPDASDRTRAGSGRDVQPVAGPLVRQPIPVPARLDRGVEDRRAKVALAGDPVVAPQLDPDGHRVLGQVWVGVLVDAVREAVPPVLEELGGRARVIDLVEVHGGRLGEAPHPQPEGRDDEPDEDPEIEPIELAATLAIEQARPVGTERTRREAAHQRVEERRPAGRRRRVGTVHARRDVPSGGRGDPRLGAPIHVRLERGGIGGAHTHDGRRRRAERERPRGRRAGRRGRHPRSGQSGGRRHGRWSARRTWDRRSRHGVGRVGDLVLERLTRGPAPLEQTPGEAHRVDGGDRRDAGEAPQGRAHPQPVVDPRVVRVDRGQDHVHVGEGGGGEHEVRGEPTPGHGREDRRHGEEREHVPLVDPGRHDEERDREDRQPDQDRLPIRTPGNKDTDDDRDKDEQPIREDRRPEGADERLGAGRAWRVRARPGDRVAQPLAALREPRAIARDERPRVEGVDREVRVAARGLADLLDEIEYRQAERRPQDRRGPEPRPQGGEQAPEAAPRARRRARVPQVAPQEDGRRDRDEDHSELDLDDPGDHSEDDRELGLVAPQGADGEQHEEEADRIHLAPDDAVEPGDRDEQVEACPDEPGAATAAELVDHRPYEGGHPDVGEDRGDLDEIRAGQGPLHGPDHPQDIQVTGRVVDERAALVEPGEAARGQILRPALERGEVVGEAGSGQDVCDDDPEGEPEREKDEDLAGCVPLPGSPHRGGGAPIGLARGGASQLGRPPARALRWIGV